MARASAAQVKRPGPAATTSLEAEERDVLRERRLPLLSRYGAAAILVAALGTQAFLSLSTYPYYFPRTALL